MDKIQWGKVVYCDCLDNETGLPSLPDKSIDMAIADFPFNVKFKGTDQKNEIEDYYKDDMTNEEYIEFCQKVFAQLRRITNGQLIFCGEPNQKIWYKYIDPEPRENVLVIKDEKCQGKRHTIHPEDEPIMIPHVAPNRQGRSSMAYLGKYDPILCYGTFNDRLPLNVITENVKMGKQRELKGGIHPCPGCSNVYRHLIKKLKPESVIDPFIGSGTTALVCMEENVQWTGFELCEEKFRGDIERRLRLGRAVVKNKKVTEEGSILDFI